MPQVTVDKTGEPPLRIAIIGAGVCGLSIAARLSNIPGDKPPFQVYEARAKNEIGHGYGVTIQKRSWKSFVRRGLRLRGSDATAAYTKLSVDAIVGGIGKPKDAAPEKFRQWQAIDRSLRKYLLEHVAQEKISWNCQLISLTPASDQKGLVLKFKDGGEVTADLIIDTAGLRAPGLSSMRELPEPKLLPYASYYGTRRITSQEYFQNFAAFFGSGNTIEYIPPTSETPFIQIKKVHHPRKSDSAVQSSTSEGAVPDHTVEIRWVYSRAPRSDPDPLWRPSRSPGEAKDIPPELIEEILTTTRSRAFSDEQRAVLDSIFTREQIKADRILNWHLRLRLPPYAAFTDKTCDKSNGYQVVALGDAAHGYPIVGSQGAVVALNDTARFVEWYLRSQRRLARDVAEVSFHADSRRVYIGWGKVAVKAIRDLRAIHGQEPLSEQEIGEIVGLSQEQMQEVLQVYDSSADEEDSDETEDSKEMRELKIRKIPQSAL